MTNLAHLFSSGFFLYLTCNRHHCLEKNGEFYIFRGRLKSFYILHPTQPEQILHKTVVFHDKLRSPLSIPRDKILQIRGHFEEANETGSISNRVCTHRDIETSRWKIWPKSLHSRNNRH